MDHDFTGFQKLPVDACITYQMIRAKQINQYNVYLFKLVPLGLCKKFLEGYHPVLVLVRLSKSLIDWSCSGFIVHGGPLNAGGQHASLHRHKVDQ